MNVRHVIEQVCEATDPNKGALFDALADLWRALWQGDDIIAPWHRAYNMGDVYFSADSIVWAHLSEMGEHLAKLQYRPTGWPLGYSQAYQKAAEKEIAQLMRLLSMDAYVDFCVDNDIEVEWL